MHITSATIYPYRVPYVATFATAHGVAHAREGVLLRLEAGEYMGWGEAAPVPGFGSVTFAEVHAALQDLSRVLVGMPVEQAAAFVPQLRQQPAGMMVACALDTALLDLEGQQEGVPVAALLGLRPPHAMVEVNATIGGVAQAQAVQQAQQAVRQGFRCIKLKVGVCATPEEEIARVAAVRAAIGAVRLRLDANGAWQLTQAVALLRELAAYDIEYIEQPVSAADKHGLAAVRSVAGMAIAADEAVTTLESARRIIAMQAADILIVKPMLAGGLHAAAAIIDLATDHGLQAVVTTTIDTVIGNAAALHCAATVPRSAPACGLATAALLVSDLHSGDVPVPVFVPQQHSRALGGAAPPTLQREGMYITVPTTPGLGVRVDYAALARYAAG